MLNHEASGDQGNVAIDREHRAEVSCVHLLSFHLSNNIVIKCMPRTATHPTFMWFYIGLLRN